MTSRAAAQARRKYELGYAAAYRDFYTRLKVIGELTLAEAISQPAGENTKKTEDSSPKLPSPFEQALFELYERIMVAYKLRLVESQLGAPLAVRRLANLAESTYQEIYQARIAEFAERAGSYGGRAFPEVYLALVPANARGHTSQLFRRLEEEILSKANAEDIVKMETDEPTPSAGPMGSVTSPGTRPSVVPVRYGRSPEGVFGESLYLENEGSPAHAVQVEPLTIGEWTVTFSEISRIKDEASSRATISCGSSGVSALDGPWLESWEAMGKPDGVPMHLVYRDFEGHSFRSICALERDVLNKDSGFSVRFVRQVVVDPPRENVAQSDEAAPPGTIARPPLNAEALKKITDAESQAAKNLKRAVKPLSPANPDFQYHPVEINAACWKVVEYLMAYGEKMFDAQARVYVERHPDEIAKGTFLKESVGPEVTRRTKRFWTLWETMVDQSLQSRWSPEYYRAYIAEGNASGSEDQKLIQNLLQRLSDVVADRTGFWMREASKAFGNQKNSGSPMQERSDLADNTDSAKQEDTTRPTGRMQKGDATLLGEKRLVSFGTAERYLGITDRQRQKLIQTGALKVEGRGQNRKITAESLKSYLPPENPN